MTIKDSSYVNDGIVNAAGNLAYGENNTIIDGNGNIIINLKEAFQYKELESRLQALDEEFNQIQKEISKSPEINYFKTRLLQISEQQNNTRREIKLLKEEVIKLAEEFQRIPINTERLQLAKQYFEAGEFDKARVILNAEAMTTELDDLKNEQKKLKNKTTENQQQLKNNANEFLILARLTDINFSLPNRFEKAKTYFEQSLWAERNQENLSGFAYFLLKHNHITTAISLYDEVLKIYRDLAKVDQQTYLPEVATALNNIGILLTKNNDVKNAQKSLQEALNIREILAEIEPQVYCPFKAQILNNLGILFEKTDDLSGARVAYGNALKIYRDLAKSDSQTYMPEVATILNNMSNVFMKENDLVNAERTVREALEIRATLADNNPQIYTPFLATTLHNLGLLLVHKINSRKAKQTHEEAQERRRILTEAEQAYKKALKIRKALVGTNPQIYLPDVAMTLHNMGIMFGEENDLINAESAYSEALDIRRILANSNPQTFLPDVAVTAVSLSYLYLKYGIIKREESLGLAKECIMSILPFVNVLPDAKRYINAALQVVKDWGFDKETFMKEFSSPQSPLS